MKLLKVGDTKKSICESCESRVKVVYELRDVPFSDGSGVVSDVLVGVCDVCDEVCSLPAQSIPMVKAARAKNNKQIESRVPAHLVDALNLASSEIGQTTDFSNVILKSVILKLRYSIMIFQNIYMY